jgi:molybdate transport system substrate-binding protein
MNWSKAIALGVFSLLLTCVPHDAFCGAKAPQQSIFIHCAAGMRNVINELALRFEAKTAIKCELNYDGSNKLLGQIKLTHKGDLYIAGDAEYIEMAGKAKLLAAGSTKTICYYTPVLLVKKGNPLGIKDLSDLLKKGVKIGMGDEKAAAIGKQTIKLLALNKIDREGWNRNVVLSTPTVNELGAAVKLGLIDAAVVWRDIANDYKNAADIIPLDPSRNIVSNVDAAVLKFAKNPHAAALFLEFIISPEGSKIMTAMGYETAIKE